MKRSKFSLTVKCHHLACPASREILAVSAPEAAGLWNGKGMQAAVAHGGDRDTKPRGVRLAHTAFAFEQGSGRVRFMALGVETWD